MRKILLSILWIIIILIVPISIYAYDTRSYSTNVPYISSVVGIEMMDVNIDVNKDNSIDVTEIITFNLVEGAPFEGIRVNFPLKDKVTGLRRNLKISDIKSNDVSIDNKRTPNYIESYLGKHNEDMTSGLYTYTLNYHYDLGNTDNRFIYKVFSNYYNLDILNMSLTINFDEDIDQDKVKFISNDNDVTNRITYGVENNVIRAAINDFILDNDLIIDVDTNDYFTNTKSTEGFISIILLIIIALSTIIMLIINIIKHKKIEDIKELYQLDIRCILALLFMIALEAIIYLFIHDLSVSFEFIYYIVYGLLSLSGILYISRLEV